MNKQSYFEKNPKKTIFFLLAFIFIVISISIETYLRIVKGDISLTEIKYDDIDGIRKYKKNNQFSIKNEIGELIEIHTDKYGFRNENKIYGDDREKIIILGDSFISNINTSYKRSLTELLNQKSDKYAYINAGIGGYSNFQMLQALTYLIDEGVIPKKVLCFIYLGNDLRDNYLSSNKSISYRISFGINETHKKNRISQPNFIQRIKNIAKRSELISRIYSLYKITKYASYFYGEAELYRRHPNKEFHSKALQSTEMILKLFKDIAEKYNIDLYFVLIPSKAQVYNEFKLISKYNKTENADEYLLDIIKEGYDFNEIAKSFSNIITKYDMKFIDLTNPFKKEIKNENKLFYIVDMHWNYTGQKIASDIINNQLISEW